MTKLSGVAELYAEIRALAELGGFDGYPRPEDHGGDDCVWLTDAGGGLFDMTYSERGQTSLVGRGDYETILFEVFRNLSQSKASGIEARQRIPNEDSRRQWFVIQSDLMAGLRPGWGERIKAEQARIIARAPFMDDR